MKPIDSGNETSTNNTNTTSSSSSGSSAYLKENIQNLFLPKALATFVSPTANGEWYVTQKAFRLPSNKRAQFYSLIVTATDQTGEIGELTFTVRTDVSQNKPFVDEDRVSVISNT